MAECPSAGWDRYIAGMDEQAEAEEEGARLEEVDRLMLRKWSQATGCPHEAWKEATRCYYKYTSCGPYLTVGPESIVIGSIVEGVDWGTQDHVLNWPFTVKDVRRAMKDVEDEADEIWRDTHGCDECVPSQYDGYRTITPGCPGCSGEGIII
jgi:hypothetical protein